MEYFAGEPRDIEQLNEGPERHQPIEVLPVPESVCSYAEQVLFAHLSVLHALLQLVIGLPLIVVTKSNF